MKKVIIIGAGGSLAQYVIDALQQLEMVGLTLFVRNQHRLLKSTAAGCTVIEGDAMIYSDVKKAVKGQDIVHLHLTGNLEAGYPNFLPLRPGFL